MKKILWASRHQLTQDQLAGLCRVCNCTENDLEITTVNQTFKSAAEIAEAATGCDYLAVVLPVGLLSDLYALIDEGQTILIPKSKRVLVDNPNGGEKIAQFVYDGWEVVEKVVYISHIVK